MVDQAASRPQTGNAGHTAPFIRVDLREETVTEYATPGVLDDYIKLMYRHDDVTYALRLHNISTMPYG